MQRIFISYRRKDSDIWADRLGDALREEFPGRVFMDIREIGPGLPWRKVLDEALRQCAALLVVIGPEWVSAADARGNRRLEDPNDTLRREVAAALRSGVRVFPLLVNSADMPFPEGLPDDLKDLADLQSHDLTVKHWREDVAKLIAVLERLPDLASAAGVEEDRSNAKDVAWRKAAEVGQRRAQELPREADPLRQQEEARSIAAAEAERMRRSNEEVERRAEQARWQPQEQERTVEEGPEGRHGEERERATNEEARKAKLEPSTGPARGVRVAAGSEFEVLLDGKWVRSDTPIMELAPFSVFRDAPDTPEMVVIPVGMFMMGSAGTEAGRKHDEGPVHQVRIDRPFALGRYALTFDEWDACVAHGSCFYRPEDQGWGRGRRPVINVSWDDAVAYIKWLWHRVDQPYRLPSEAEWEYAARAGTTTRYPWGDDPGTSQANFRGSGSQWGGKQTAPVGSFEPNAWGLYDMIGNVWEWVQDYSKDSYAGAPTDGSAWLKRSFFETRMRVLRGGSWGGQFGPVDARSANRGRGASSDRDESNGFRLARTLL